MKKFGIFLTVILCISVLYACKSPQYNKAIDNLAEIRNNIYIGENESVKGVFMSGEREKEYVINGYATPLIEFGVITFSLIGTNLTPAKTGTYTIKIDNETYNGQLELNPFDNTYVADIGVKIQTNKDIVAKITIGSFESEITLRQRNKDWKTTSLDALKLACKSLKKEIKNYDKEDFECEVYVKIIHDENISSDKYFWYVNFVGRKGINHSVIIDPNTKEILAKK